MTPLLGGLRGKWVLGRGLLGGHWVPWSGAGTFSRAWRILGKVAGHAMIPGPRVSKPDTGVGVNTSP